MLITLRRMFLHRSITYSPYQFLSSPPSPVTRSTRLQSSSSSTSNYTLSHCFLLFLFLLSQPTPSYEPHPAESLPLHFYVFLSINQPTRVSLPPLQIFAVSSFYLSASSSAIFNVVSPLLPFQFSPIFSISEGRRFLNVIFNRATARLFLSFTFSFSPRIVSLYFCVFLQYTFERKISGLY